MSLYMIQFSYTSDAWASLVKNPTDRTEALRALLEKVGARMEALYYAMGDHDGVVIVEAPDEKTVASAMLAAVTPGHLKSTKTTVLMRPEDMVEAMRAAGGATYSAPRD